MARWSGRFDEVMHGFMLVVITLMLVLCTGSLFIACGPGSVEESVPAESVASCTLDSVRYPTTAVAFGRLYSGRSFLVDGVHLGRDIDLAEGTSIYPIGCGTVQVYRAATGYGTLAVVVEHRLPRSVRVRNGAGEMVEVREFLSIYGHLRSTSARSGGVGLPLRAGDGVNSSQVIGYVQNAALNGDGAEHLHFAIRLQNWADAQRTDPSAPFRGYDGSPSQRRWFADPQVFMTALQSGGADVTWHPPGSVLARASRSTDRWVVSEEQTLRAIDTTTLTNERLASQVVSVSDEEIGCYRMASPYVAERNGYRVMRFSDSPAVYEYTDTPRPMRYTFISQEAFVSWGWRNEEVEVRTAAGRSTFLTRYMDGGMRRLRDGALVKGRGMSEVSVVSRGMRLPLADWSIFLGLGYREERIFEIDPSTLEVVAGPRGPVITLERARTCRYRDCSLGDSCGEPERPPPSMDAGLPVIDASVDVVPDLPREEPMPGGVRDAMVTVDATVPSEDAGVRPTSMDAGLVTGGMDAGIVMDASGCPDPVRPPMSSMDAGVDATRDSGASVMDVMSASPDVSVSPLPDVPQPTPPAMGTGVRYEFRLARDLNSWAPTPPYYLRDHWWRIQSCANVMASTMDPARSRMESVGDGWYRCDLASRLSPFVGTFFSPGHPESGDRGHIATIDNWPERCSPRAGVEWRITDLASGRRLYEGPSSGLPCIPDGAQDRHGLP